MPDPPPKTHCASRLFLLRPPASDEAKRPIRVAACAQLEGWQCLNLPITANGRCVQLPEKDEDGNEKELVVPPQLQPPAPESLTVRTVTSPLGGPWVGLLVHAARHTESHVVLSLPPSLRVCHRNRSAGGVRMDVFLSAFLYKISCLC